MKNESIAMKRNTKLSYLPVAVADVSVDVDGYGNYDDDDEDGS